MSGGMVVTTCVCGLQQWQAVVSTKDGVSVVRCACGVLRTQHRSVDYMRTYTDGTDYHAGKCQEMYGYEPYADRFLHDQAIAQARIPKYMQAFKALDVGCANGAFVHELANQGWDAFGLELNPAMAAWAHERTQRPIYTAWSHVWLKHAVGSFDLLTYHDVFEHVVDPVRELATAKTALRAGGLLVLDVPDGDEVFGTAARARHHEKPEQHMWYWTQDTLLELLFSKGWVLHSVDRPIVGKLVVSVRRRSL